MGVSNGPSINSNKRSRKIIILILLTALSGLNGWAKVPQPPDSVKTVAELDAYLERLVKSGIPPGLSLVIVKNDSIVYSKGFGWADYPREIRATPQTVYHWWSITKIVTAMAILQLQERGKLRLDDSVSKYLPFFKVRYPSPKSQIITIRHLLNHSSGIPDAGPFCLMQWIHHDGEPPVNQTAFVEKVFPKFSKLKFEPGENTAYTNVGYMLLGAIIEKVSMQNYEDYVRQNILQPLGMKHTDFVYTREMGPFEAAGSHPAYSLLSQLLYLMKGSYIRETCRKHIWMERIYTDQTPSSALIGSAMDAARLARAYLNYGLLDGQRILSEKSVSIMTNEGHVPKYNEEAFYHSRGIGWQVNKGEDGFRLEHMGSAPGFFTMLWVYPQDKFGLILFCNDLTVQGFGGKILRLAAKLYK